MHQKPTRQVAHLSDTKRGFSPRPALLPRLQSVVPLRDDPVSDPMVDRLVDGRYRIRERLAQGGMGSVYVAVDSRLEREVALKVMRPDLAADAAFVQRFRREARSAAQLTHPNVVAVYDQGADQAVVFLAMELVIGQTLRSWLSTVGALTPREALDVLSDVLQALAAAHQAGLVHRDVKPENVLIGANGVVKVADFGLARAVSAHTSTTAAGAMLGTVAYLAPEQVERGIADARSDVYAAGLVLYEMLTGSRAFDGDSPIHVAYQHVHGSVPVPSHQVPGLPAELDALVAWATHRDPDRRPADAGQFLAQVRSSRQAIAAADLDRRPDVVGRGGSADTARLALPTRVVPLTGATSPPPEQNGPGRSPRRRSRVAGWTVLSLVVALALAAGVWWYQFLGPGGVRTVPTTIGQIQDVALTRLDDEQLVPQVHEEFSETVSKGTVIGSDPNAGAQTRRGTPIRLVISKGPERYPVPAVVGKTVAAATTSVTEGRLTIAGTRQRWHEQLAEGLVMATDPRVGTDVRPGTPVTLIVSKGKEPIEVADWTGKPLKDMQRALSEKQIAVTVSEQKYHPTVSKDAVISQTPGPGTLHRGDKVTVVVSKGPDLIEVPSVRGMPEDQARGTLEDAGFSVKIERIAGGLFGTAHSSVPAGGQKAPRDGVVVLRIV